jgi:hypothetical protein
MELIEEKAKTHGDFTDQAQMAQGLKSVLHASRRWDGMTAVQREAAEMILHKLARACSGDPWARDHWQDIAGYATMVADRSPCAHAAEIYGGSGGGTAVCQGCASQGDGVKL